METHEILALIDKRLLKHGLIEKEQEETQQELPFVEFDLSISDDQLFYLVSKRLLDNRKHTLDSLEKKVIDMALKHCNYNKSITSRKLGISWQSLDRRMKKYDIIERKKIYKNDKYESDKIN